MLKQRRCPFCGRVGTLNRHSRLTGNDPTAAQGRVRRGQRAFCCNRGRRGGCGRTFSVLLAWVLPRHTFTAPWLWRTLDGRRTGRSIKSGWERLCPPFALETLYHLLQRLRRRLAPLRAHLCRAGPPPTGDATDPLEQTIAHLRAAFPAATCPLEAFQLRFQRPLMG